MEVLHRDGMAFLGDPTQGAQNEFYRAMWCPEVERDRQRAENEVAYTRHRYAGLDNIFRFDRDYGYNGRRGDTYTVSLTLYREEFSDIRGHGEEFAAYIARRLIEQINNDSLYQRRM